MGGGRGSGAGSGADARGWSGGAHLGGREAPTGGRPPLPPRSEFGVRRISFVPRGLPVDIIIIIN